MPTEEESTSDHPHVQQIVDEDIHEATMIPDKKDFQGKIILKEHLYKFF